MQCCLKGVLTKSVTLNISQGYDGRTARLSRHQSHLTEEVAIGESRNPFARDAAVDGYSHLSLTSHDQVKPMGFGTLASHCLAGTKRCELQPGCHGESFLQC